MQQVKRQDTPYVMSHPGDTTTGAEGAGQWSTQLQPTTTVDAHVKQSPAPQETWMFDQNLAPPSRYGTDLVIFPSFLQFAMLCHD